MAGRGDKVQTKSKVCDNAIIAPCGQKQELQKNCIWRRKPKKENQDKNKQNTKQEQLSSQRDEESVTGIPGKDRRED